MFLEYRALIPHVISDGLFLMNACPIHKKVRIIMLFIYVMEQRGFQYGVRVCIVYTDIVNETPGKQGEGLVRLAKMCQL